MENIEEQKKSWLKVEEALKVKQVVVNGEGHDPVVKYPFLIGAADLSFIPKPSQYTSF